MSCEGTAPCGEQNSVNVATQKFCDYININTAHPRPDYNAAKVFLENYGKEIDIPYQVFEYVSGKPLVLFSLLGTDQSAGSILLNSHIDVVAATPELWDTDPFIATIKNGNLYGRGTQDMKCVGIQHLEAIRLIKESGKKLKRTVHILFVPDEEIGGLDGMAMFVKTEEFRALNIAVSVDEGVPSEGDAISICYGEREPWQLIVSAKGPAGHASRFIENTAMMKLVNVISKFTEFREVQYQKLFDNHSCGMALGDVITVNLTYLEGGAMGQFNVIPVEAKAGFDIRIPPTEDREKLLRRIESWTSEEGVSVSFHLGNPEQQMNNNLMVPDNVWWKAMKQSLVSQNIETNWEIFPMATDSRYLRQLNIPAFGFSPITRTKNLMHDHNEYLPIEVFLKGIPIIRQLVEDLANT